VIDAGYGLHNNYTELMLADNNRLTNEILFAVPYDGLRSKNYGGTTFLVNASIGAPMIAANYGMSGTGWAGLRTTKNLPLLFKDGGVKADSTDFDYRAQFFTQGVNIEINSVSAFAEGYKVIKFRNLKSDGSRGSNFAEAFSDIDFPLFRLPEMYLIYAESVLRGATNGDAGTALGYINSLRARAYRNDLYGNTNGQINSADLTLQFVLDERARELYWEGHRRTDLIRYNLFSGGEYLWPFKGGQRDGAPISEHLELYPIPSDDLVSNPNLKQNPGY
jgi:starch-binding outer membrane protein, SusD/RagB family